MMDEFDLEDSPTLPTISLPTLITHPAHPVTLLPPWTRPPGDFTPWTTPPSDFTPWTRPPGDYILPRAVDLGSGSRQGRPFLFA